MAASAAIDRSSPLPLFYQVAERLKERLGTGRYRVGDRFLTVREVVGEFGVSFVTAQRALARLAQEQLVKSRRGSGTVVSESAAGRVRRAPKRARPQTRRILVLRPTHWPVAPSFHSNIASILDGLRAALPGHPIAMEFPDEVMLKDENDAYLSELVSSDSYAGFCLLASPASVKRFFEHRARGVVVVGDVEPGIRLSFVSSAEERAHYDLTRHLMAKGHTRIAQIIGTPRVVGHEDRLKGYRRALQEAGLRSQSDRRDLEVAVPYDRDRVLAHVEHLLQSPDAPTAIICTGSVIASWLHAGVGSRVKIAYDVNSDAQEPMLPGSIILIWPGYQFGYAAGMILQDQFEKRLGIQERVIDYVAIRDC